jgi:hypothetical protein
MIYKEARQTAAARGFSSVRQWMKENRKAWQGFNSRRNVKGENRERLARLMSALDAEFNQWKHLQ